LTKSLSAAISAYDVYIHNPIVFGVTPLISAAGFASNYGYINSRGLQPELRYRSYRWDLTANYSYYYGSSNVPGYGDSTTAPKGILLGAPTHELNVFARLGLTQKLSFNPSVHFISRRYGNFSASNPNAFESIPQVAIWGFNIRAVDFWKQGTEADFGIQNLFDASYDVTPGYSNSEGVTPGLSRAFVAKLGYKFGI
jgi:outer membrane receptor for Fe3+-dicitrate